LAMRPASVVVGVRATLRARNGTWMCLKGTSSGVTRALADSSDNHVESLTSSTIADLTLVQYGDVDLSATFLIA
jgi:hypothetical protein